MQSPRANVWLLAALGAAVVLFLLSRTQQGAQVVANVTDSIGSSIRGYRLNNPLNVELGQPWDGLAADQPDARFANFVSIPYGIRAWAKIMQTYAASYNINTISGIINRWNPVSDGQSTNYIPDVADAMGLTSSSPIDVTDFDIAFALCRAMMKEEIGVAALLVSDDDVTQGLNLAGISS